MLIYQQKNFTFLFSAIMCLPPFFFIKMFLFLLPFFFTPKTFFRFHYFEIKMHMQSPPVLCDQNTNPLPTSENSKQNIISHFPISGGHFDFYFHTLSWHHCLFLVLFISAIFVNFNKSRIIFILKVKYFNYHLINK